MGMSTQLQSNQPVESDASQRPLAALTAAVRAPHRRRYVLRETFEQ